MKEEKGKKKKKINKAALEYEKKMKEKAISQGSKIDK